MADFRSPPVGATGMIGPMPAPSPTAATPTPISASEPAALDFDRCYAAVDSRDPRFDGQFITGVLSTGIYCRPSCPALTPKRQNVRFYLTAAAAQRGGLRACKRCLPDATPGSPRWNLQADTVGRAMRLIADGVVDREGVGGLAHRLGYSERHLRRLLVAEVGAGPLDLARSQRAQTARILIETTDLPMSRIAFAAGYASIRAFNDAMQQTFSTAPQQLRTRARRGGAPRGDESPGVTSLHLRLAFRSPFDVAASIRFLAARAVPGVEEVRDGVYRRALRLPRGAAVVALRPPDAADSDEPPTARPSDDTGFVHCHLRLSDLRDLTTAVRRCRVLLDLDADPWAVHARLTGGPHIARLVDARPGLRMVAAPDGGEAAVRAILGQQVSVAGAATQAGRLAQEHGDDLPVPDASLGQLFPDVGRLAALEPAQLRLPQQRARALVQTSARIGGAGGIGPGTDAAELADLLGDVRGVGPWTLALIRLRGLADPDVLLPGDLGVRRGLEHIGVAPETARRSASAWAPWRSYVTHHLWAAAAAPTNEAGTNEAGTNEAGTNEAGRAAA